MTIYQRKKLIEVSLPLEAINKASAREKSIRHGHPSTLHLWWARRPLAACRAVLFSQIVDDPSSWPEEFPTEEDQENERARLHGIIAEMVPWEATNDATVLHKARYEIARSLARERGEKPPTQDDAQAVLTWLTKNAPPVCDPFCGGGSIPLEAQRLGLRAHGSDLNPVAVLISKATCEIPPKFSELSPVNPQHNWSSSWKGAQGMAEDIRHYGRWMRDKAESQIGHLYPKIEITKAMAKKREDLKAYAGQKLTVIAWLWARTVASPDPMKHGTHIPLVSSFVLSSKKHKKAIIVPMIDHSGNYRFTVKTGNIGTDELEKARAGTKALHGARANFTCLLSGAPIPGNHIKAEGIAGRMGMRLMAIVAKGHRERVYLDPTEDMETTAQSAEPAWRPEGRVPERLTGGTCYPYGLTSWGDLFTDRQLVAMVTFSNLINEAREKILADALTAGMNADALRLASGGIGAEAYADAVATYLGLCVSRLANRSSNLSFWHSGRGTVEQVFARQALPMVWDFCEANPFSSSTGNFVGQVSYLANVVEATPFTTTQTAVIQQNAAGSTHLLNDAIVETDPPYYDNIGYADLSDFFYVWQRRTLRSIWPDLFRRVLVPKQEELVATPYRHGNKDAAEKFFMDGMRKALRNIHRSGTSDFPITIYYAFKKSEVGGEGLASPGWATFLQSLVDAGYSIDGTWPVRTELSGNLKKQFNALASSIVLVCRKRPTDAPAIMRREFFDRLRAKLPDALAKIRDGGVGPVDMAQAALGPGMGIFTTAAKVLEADDTPMTVREAIALINQVRDEISGKEKTSYDPGTRFCIDWFEAFGMESGDAGDAIIMAQAYDIGIGDLEAAGVFATRSGNARLLRRDELPNDWDPTLDRHLTDWECAQHLAKVLESPEGGIAAAAHLFEKMGPSRGEAARLLAYRLYDICERKDRATEAQTWNMLAREWQALEAATGVLNETKKESILPLEMPDNG